MLSMVLDAGVKVVAGVVCLVLMYGFIVVLTDDARQLQKDEQAFKTFVFGK